MQAASPCRCIARQHHQAGAKRVKSNKQEPMRAAAHASSSAKQVHSKPASPSRCTCSQQHMLAVDARYSLCIAARSRPPRLVLHNAIASACDCGRQCSSGMHMRPVACTCAREQPLSANGHEQTNSKGTTYACPNARSQRSAMLQASSSVTRRKPETPGNAPNDNTTHVPTATSSADLTKPNHTPTRHTRTKDKTILQMATPQAASSRTHVSRTQGRGRTHPVNSRVATQYVHTQSITTRHCII